MGEEGGGEGTHTRKQLKIVIMIQIKFSERGYIRIRKKLKLRNTVEA